MPTITPSYLYTFFAIIAVSSMLLVSFIGYTNAIRFSSETRKLKDLMESVAAKATELLALANSVANMTAETFIQAPTTIGDKSYWLRLRNESEKAFVEGGLGNTPTEETELRVYLPTKASVLGSYLSGHGAICLTCFRNATLFQVQLSSSSSKGG